MTHTAPVSLSVYRGQSLRGIGEGPGRPVTQGEQYLGASPELARDAELLDAIRLWMSLDSDPADHTKLHDHLEAWSFCTAGRWQLVARLASAGTFLDGRAAYFSHGRLWPLDAGAGFDPGLHLGRSEAFETPWRDDSTGQRVPEPDQPLFQKERIEAEPDVAALFLAHLLQSCSRQRPLAVLAPLSEFAAGASLPSLVAFARGALPADLRKECRVRIYTRTPELFLRSPGAALIAMPEDLQERVQSVRRDARLIDRQGRVLAGEPLDPVAQAYAEAVLERALRIPAGLTRFGERFRDRRSRTPGLPDQRDVRGIQVTYNLAVALAGSAEDRGDLVRSYLPRVAQKLGLEVDWRQLITSEEWQAFPLEPLLGLLFMDTQELPPGVRELQKAVEQSGALVRAVEQGVLDPARVRTFLQSAPASRLASVAQELLRVRGLFGGSWGDSPALLLEGLRRLPRVPPELAPLLLQAGRELDPAAGLPLYLRLADLLARIEEEAGPQGGNELRARLWRALPQITDPEARDLLVEAALSPQWRCLQPQSLALAGQLREPWLETMAPRLVEHQDLLQALDVAALLRLAARLETQGDLERVFDSVDIHLTRDLQSVTDSLTWAGWWTAWRKMSRLLVGEPGWRRPAAEAWLTSRSWTREEAREATQEDWSWVMQELSAGPLDAGRPLPWSGGGGPRRLWPWIPPFEEEQLADLARKAPDLGSLAELAEALLSDPARPDFGEPVHRYILRHSIFARHFLQEDALGWLVDKEWRGELPALNLATSLQLWRQAARLRPDQASQARLASVLHCLKADEQAEAAIEAASEPSLWASPRFLGGLAAWMNKRGSVAKIDRGLAEKIDQRIQGEPDRRPKGERKLIQELLKLRLKKAAALLDSGPPGEIEQESLIEAVIEALATGSRNDECWPELAAAIESGSASRHPLTSIAERIREEEGERRALLVRRGWRNFEEAARAHPWLMTFRSEQTDLPVFDLAASLSAPGGLGNAALSVLFSAEQSQRGRIEWWEALLHGLLTWRRHPSLVCPEDRPDVALALVVRLLDDLQEEERQVFWGVFERGAGQFSESNHLVGAQ